MDEADRILNLDFEKEASGYFTYMYRSYKKKPFQVFHPDYSFLSLDLLQKLQGLYQL